MTIGDITLAINGWKSIQNQFVDITDFFNQGNLFDFTLPSYASGSDFMHAYPGIYNDKLVFMMIPAQYDTAEYAATIDQYVTVWNIRHEGTGGNGNQIKTPIAKERIGRWKMDYPNWIETQVLETVVGIFDAFVIPMEDFEVADSEVYMALKANGQQIQPYDAELIVMNPMTGLTKRYDDYSQPVPPYSFSPSAATLQANFFLGTL